MTATVTRHIEINTQAKEDKAERWPERFAVDHLDRTLAARALAKWHQWTRAPIHCQSPISPYRDNFGSGYQPAMEFDFSRREKNGRGKLGKPNGKTDRRNRRTDRGAIAAMTWVAGDPEIV